MLEWTPQTLVACRKHMPICLSPLLLEMCLYSPTLPLPSDMPMPCSNAAAVLNDAACCPIFGSPRLGFRRSSRRLPLIQRIVRSARRAFSPMGGCCC